MSLLLPDTSVVNARITSKKLKVCVFITTCIRVVLMHKLLRPGGGKLLIFHMFIPKNLPRRLRPVFSTPEILQEVQLSPLTVNNGHFPVAN